VTSTDEFLPTDIDDQPAESEESSSTDITTPVTPTGLNDEDDDQLQADFAEVSGGGAVPMSQRTGT
jgi:hypothetical protein